MKLPKQIQFWDTDEPGVIIVTLHYGWSFEPEGCGHEGVRGFDTAKEALKAARSAYPCRCKLCQKEKGGPDDERDMPKVRV